VGGRSARHVAHKGRAARGVHARRAHRMRTRLCTLYTACKTARVRLFACDPCNPGRGCWVGEMRGRAVSPRYTRMLPCARTCARAQRMAHGRADTFSAAASAAWEAGTLDDMQDHARRDIWRSPPLLPHTRAALSLLHTRSHAHARPVRILPLDLCALSPARARPVPDLKHALTHADRYRDKGCHMQKAGCPSYFLELVRNMSIRGVHDACACAHTHTSTRARAPWHARTHTRTRTFAELNEPQGLEPEPHIRDLQHTLHFKR